MLIQENAVYHILQDYRIIPKFVIKYTGIFYMFFFCFFLSPHLFVICLLSFNFSLNRYDPQTNQWSSDVAPTSSCRTSVGVAVLDGHMYAVGGQDGVSCLNFVERYLFFLCLTFFDFFLVPFSLFSFIYHREIFLLPFLCFFFKFHCSFPFFPLWS